MKTIITHFYNEEFLLPFWLEHHKKIFDFGVLIDYGSTDKSLEICRKICPHWQIIPSAHVFFDHKLCDQEVEFVESQIDGWRISIPVTEFVVGNVERLMTDTQNNQNYYLPVVIFTGYNPEGKIDTTKKLWHQITEGFPPYVDHALRSLHNYKGLKYPPGRHFWGDGNTSDAMIFKYSSCLVGPEMIKRRLQIQNKVSDSDRKLGVAEHHVYSKMNGLTMETLKSFYVDTIASKNPIDCSTYIEKLNLSEPKKMNYITSTIINNLPNIEQLSYLELGIGNGLNFKSILSKTKVSVDITPGVALFTGTTDDFFKNLNDEIMFDIIFIDADHSVTQVVKDFNNAIDHGTKWILLHDLYPSEEIFTLPQYSGDGFRFLYHLIKNTNFEVYPMDNNCGFTLVKLPAGKVELSNEAKNLNYRDFVTFMSNKKLYNTLEIEEMLRKS